MKCNKDCFNCPYDDCIVDDDITESAVIEHNRKMELNAKLKQKRKEYYQANRERILSYNAQYRAENKEHLRAKRHERYVSDKSNALEYQRQYYRRAKEVETPEHREKRLTYQREYDKEYQKKYYSEHRDERRQYFKQHNMERMAAE